MRAHSYLFLCTAPVNGPRDEPTFDDRIGPLILLIFFGMLVFGYVYVYFAIPETKGLSLEEVGLFRYLGTHVN